MSEAIGAYTWERIGSANQAEIALQMQKLYTCMKGHR